MSSGGLASKNPESVKSTCTLLLKAIRFLPVNFLFDNKTLIVLLESLFQVSMWILTEMIVIGSLKYLYI
jgi:hypothetical protein